MKSIAFLSQKGGSGKTTLAVHIAVAASKHEKVVIVDCDPQGSATAWGQARKNKPPTVQKIAPSALPEALRKANDATLAIIDTPPHATPGMDVVASSVDVLLIPCRPSAFDLVAIASSVQIAKAAGTPAAFVLNGANSRSPEYNEARKVLERQRAGRYRGLCRYRDLLDLKVHVRIPALEDGAQFPVERSHSRL
jgi:chromosome partitioning protein